MTDFVFYIHIASLCLAGLGVLLADKSALAWLRGKTDTVSRRALFVSHWVVTAGLVGLILSGLYLFWPMRDFLLNQPLFWLKMAFVIALIINSFFIDHLMHTAARQSFRSLSFREKVPFIISGAVSTISWAGAGVTALLLF